MASSQAPRLTSVRSCPRYMRGLKHKPKRLPMSFWGWILPVYRTTEDEMIRIAGFDAATYMRIIAFGTRDPNRWTLLC